MRRGDDGGVGGDEGRANEKRRGWRSMYQAFAPCIGMAFAFRSVVGNAVVSEASFRTLRFAWID